MPLLVRLCQYAHALRQRQVDQMCERVDQTLRTVYPRGPKPADVRVAAPG
jgi:hypothetical protein